MEFYEERMENMTHCKRIPKSERVGKNTVLGLTKERKGIKKKELLGI